MNPTDELYRSLKQAYDHFNKTLFADDLPAVLFTVQRKKGISGYFAAERWSSLDGTRCHEIAINPTHIGDSLVIEVLQTLVHEMVHCWQHVYGKPARDSYHNKEWAYKMIEIGLQPSDTGKPGGAIVGQHMSDYPIKSGLFIRSAYALIASHGFNIPWIDRRQIPKLHDPEGSAETVISSAVESVRESETPEVTLTPQEFEQALTKKYSVLLPANTFISSDSQPKKQKRKYQCPSCLSNVWGKPDLNLVCGDCNVPFLSD